MLLRVPSCRADRFVSWWHNFHIGFSTSFKQNLFVTKLAYKGLKYPVMYTFEIVTKPITYIL